MAQSVEHILGKDEVTSSILVTSSKVNAHSQETVDGHFGFCKQGACIFFVIMIQ